MSDAENKLIIDAGTTWSKVLELSNSNEEDSLLSDICPQLNEYIIENSNTRYTTRDGETLKGKIYIFPSSFLIKQNLLFDSATGHMVKNRIKESGRYENEVIALAYGAQKLIPELNNATIVDIGSRDIKWVSFREGKYSDLDWNGNCGSATGATLEMLSKFYNIDTTELNTEDHRIPVTCGVFAMEKIMDMIASGISPEIALSRYIHGIAYNTWSFARKPDQLYLSGGFCMNSCFIESLKKYCEVKVLGRFTLLEGLY